MVLIKTTSTGDILWNKRYSGSLDRDVGQAVYQTSDDGFIAVGFTGTAFAEDIFLVKTDLNGNEQWTQVYESSGRDLAYSIKQLSDGGYIMVGQTNSIGAGEEDIYLIRTNEFGDTIWTRTFGTESFEIGRSVEPTDDGGFIIVGYENTVGGNVLLIKTDDQGILEWSEEYESDGWDFAHSIKQVSDGGLTLLVDAKRI